MTPDLFKRAKEAASIAGVAGVKLFRAGKRMRGQCPLCGSGKGKKSGGPFSVDPAGQHFKCWSCGEDGDVVKLEWLLHGGTLVDAARRLAGDGGTAPLPRPAAMDVKMPDGPTFSERFAAEIWGESVPAGSTLVQRYLMSRFIRGPVLLQMLRYLRFHPHVYHSGPRSRPIVFPAMLLQVVVPGPNGEPVPTGGIHATYLARDGSGKAPLPPEVEKKKMWGPQSLDGVPGGGWLSDIRGDGPLLNAEGIETVGSMAMLHRGPARMCAALALDRLQGGYLTDKWGRFDPDLPQGDPERPPFTWPEPQDAPWGEVIIGIDHDMKPIKVRVRAPIRGGTMHRTLYATERARLCAALSTSAWRRRGAPKVRSVAPPLGEDFNDKLKREEASEFA